MSVLILGPNFLQSLSADDKSLCLARKKLNGKGHYRGAQWLGGRVFDSRWRGCGFKPHRQHCIVSLSKTLILCFVLVQPRKTQHDMTEKMLTGMQQIKAKKQTNK